MSINQFMFGRWLQKGWHLLQWVMRVIHEKFIDKGAVKLSLSWGMWVSLAPLIGPLIGGVIVSYSSWRYIFILTCILGFYQLVWFV